MVKESTILLNKDIIEMLKKAKDNPNETYNELIRKLVLLYFNVRKRDQYDKFLHEIQKHKMKELWNNKENEIWENA
jgi:predicted CopG family antitoxin